MNGKKAREMRRFVRDFLKRLGQSHAFKKSYRFHKRAYARSTGPFNALTSHPKPLKPRVHKRKEIVLRGVGKPKRPWREGEPIHVLRPVRDARLQGVPK